MKLKPTESESRAKELCRELRRKRIAAGVTIRELAARVGVGRDCICELESAKRTHVPIDLLIDCANAIGFKLDIELQIRPTECPE